MASRRRRGVEGDGGGGGGGGDDDELLDEDEQELAVSAAEAAAARTDAAWRSAFAAAAAVGACAFAVLAAAQTSRPWYHAHHADMYAEGAGDARGAAVAALDAATAGVLLDAAVALRRGRPGVRAVVCGAAVSVGWTLLALHPGRLDKRLWPLLWLVAAPTALPAACVYVHRALRDIADATAAFRAAKYPHKKL